MLLWYSPAGLVAGNKEIQQELEEMVEIAMKVMACKEGSDRMNVITELEKVGIDMIHTDKLVTDWLKSRKKY